MSRPSWVLRCRACKAQFGPLFAREHVQVLLAGELSLGCGHLGADVASESL